MKAWNEFTHFAGFDWAKNHHDVVIVDRNGTIVADFQFEHSAQGWKYLRKQLTALGLNVAVCVETSQGSIVEQLLDSGATVYPISPLAAKNYRGRKVPSGNKTDRIDAWSLGDALRVDGHGWKALEKEDPIIAELRLLCRDEVALIEDRTALVNQLQTALYEYYPAALEAFDDWTMPGAWEFVAAFPTPAALQAAGKRKWEKFLHAHKLARPQTYEKRMKIFAESGEFTSGEALTRSKSRLALARIQMLRVLQSQIDAYRAEIEKLFAKHPDHDLFGSLPGSGPKIGPRLLGEIGADRARFADPNGLQCMAGTAPVSYQSGQIHIVYLRWHCNKLLRHTVHLWADQSRHSCSWAAVYYDQLRERGKSHACALRCLGQRWLKILWKMWQDRTTYDPAIHTRNQLKHGSWVFKLLPT